MEPRVLIVGANGFLGEALARHLQQEGYAVTGTRLPETPDPHLLGVAVMPMRIDRSAELQAVMSNHDVVINAAGNLRGDRRAAYHQANVQVLESLVCLLQSITNPPLLLHLSSVAAIGPTSDGHERSEDAPCRPVSLYGRTKRDGEQVLWRALQRNPRLPLLILRPPSLFGPGDPCFFDLFAWASRGYSLKLCTRHKRFNLLYVRDLTTIIERLIRHRHELGRSGDRLLHIGFADAISDDRFSAELGRCFGRALRSLYLGPGVCRLISRLYCLIGRLKGRPALFGPSKVDEMSQSFWLQSFARFHSLFPDLRPTPLVDALTETLEWYRRQEWLS